MINPRGRGWRLGAVASAVVVVAAIAIATRVQSPREAPEVAIRSTAIEEARPESDGSASEIEATPAVLVPALDATVIAESSREASTPDGSAPLYANGDFASATERVAGEPYSPAELDSPPRLNNVRDAQREMEVRYPKILRDAGIGGKVLAEMVIRPDGTVDPASIRIKEASHERFAEATIGLIQTFRYSPGVLGDSQVPVLIQMPISWRADS